MVKLYLLFNAVLYAGFAVWCSLKWAQTSQASGYLTLNNDGRSEYLVIYGGLQLGLAAFFAYVGFNSQHQAVGLVFALCIYFAIVLYRLVSIGMHWPVGSVTLGIAALEVLLLITGIIVYAKQ